jgi:hypothetical protein
MAEVTIEVRPNGLIPEPLPPDAPADFRLEIIAAVEGALPTGTSSGVPTREIVMSPRSVVRSSVSDIASCARSRAIFLRSRHRAAARHVPEGCLGRVCASHPGDDAGSARSARRPHPRAFSASATVLRAHGARCNALVARGGGHSRAPSTSRKALVIGPRIPPRGCLDKRIRTRLRRGASAHWRGSCG